MPPGKSTNRVGPGGARRLAPAGDHGRDQRTLREGVQHVGDQQFLVLLLVLQAEFDQRRRLRLCSASRRAMAASTWRAVGADLAPRRAG